MVLTFCLMSIPSLPGVFVFDFMLYRLLYIFTFSFSHRYAKIQSGVDWTELQFTMTAVPVSDSFPLGVKTIYRKYSANEVLLIENSDNPSHLLGFKVVSLEVVDQPMAFPPHIPEGMFFLRSLPERGTPLYPDAFVEGSRDKLIGVVDYIQKVFGRHMPEVVREWENFREK